MSEWRHHPVKGRWVLGYQDESREQFVAIGWVTGEFLDRTYPAMSAAAIRARFGSVPPPLAGYLLPDPPVLYEAGASQ